MMDNVYSNIDFIKEEKKTAEIRNSSTRKTSASRISQRVPSSTLRLLCGLSALCVVLLILNITVTFTKSSPNCSNVMKTEVISDSDSMSTPCPEDWSLSSGKCYYFSNVPVSWEEAKHACEKKKSNLIVINSKTEQDYAVKISLGQYTWIGLTEIDNEWKWVDGTPYNSKQTYWKEGQPNNWSGHLLPGGEDCAQIQFGGQWNDEHCSNPWRYICEKKSEV
ncbi:C-type lectin domain family 10 member A [Xenopus laevis]|uniref:C-type lectin domain family 10 member A n=2 Tax=Xenopus laevis TaxID=8355 RepID=A0A1L8H4B4_XENLA|nr:C-type lectin domain family 10 member A [Xenopus laevis]OCT90929.1 hypothetical protein XELAEV_18019546mg [Xenopus laevis]